MIAKKRLLPILVAVLMVFAMMPMTADRAYARDSSNHVFEMDTSAKTIKFDMGFVTMWQSPYSVGGARKTGVTDATYRAFYPDSTNPRYLISMEEKWYQVEATSTLMKTSDTFDAGLLYKYVATISSTYNGGTDGAFSLKNYTPDCRNLYGGNFAWVSGPEIEREDNYTIKYTAYIVCTVPLDGVHPISGAVLVPDNDLGTAAIDLSSLYIMDEDTCSALYQTFMCLGLCKDSSNAFTVEAVEDGWARYGQLNVDLTGDGNYDICLDEGTGGSPAKLSLLGTATAPAGTYTFTIPAKAPSYGTRMMSNYYDFWDSYYSTLVITIPNGAPSYDFGETTVSLKSGTAKLEGQEALALREWLWNANNQSLISMNGADGTNFVDLNGDNKNDFMLKWEDGALVLTLEDSFSNAGSGEKIALPTSTVYSDYSYSAVTFLIPFRMADAAVTGIADKVYTGSSLTQDLTVSYNGSVLTKGTDYKLSYKNNTNAGTAAVTITGTGDYFGTINRTFKINQAANPLKVSAKTATVKYSKLKKKTQTLAVTKVIKFTKKLNDKKTYTLVSAKKGSKSFKKYFKINKTTGKVTIKKNKKMKKGTYKVKVKVKALGNSNYKASAVKSVTFKVKVK